MYVCVSECRWDCECAHVYVCMYVCGSYAKLSNNFILTSMQNQVFGEGVDCLDA